MTCGIPQDGMNVVVAMSQPPPCLFACLDTLLLLGPGGRPVFSGPRLLLSSYLYFLGFRPPPGELGPGGRGLGCMLSLAWNAHAHAACCLSLTRCYRVTIAIRVPCLGLPVPQP